MGDEGKEDVVVSDPIRPQVRIGRARLRVTDLRRATVFYRDDVLGLEVTMYGPDVRGVEAAFLAAGGYHHHHIGLNTPGTAPAGRRLPRAAPACSIQPSICPDRRELAKAAERVLDHGHAFTGGQRTPAGEAVYLDDPDGNGLELY